jgi:hypothetical protein
MPMLNISKYHKLIVGCSAIATASIGGFVQSASATEQFSTKNSQSHLGSVLIAGNVSNGGGGNVSNAGGGNVSNGGGGNVSNGGGVNDSNAGGKDPKPGDKPGDKDKDKKDQPTGSNTTGTSVTAGSSIGIGSGKGGSKGGSQPGFGNQSNMGKAIAGRLSSAEFNLAKATATLSQLENVVTNTSSSTSPVRYGREPGDIAACGCPNADTVGNNSTTPRPELVAAKAAEAAAAAELAAAKAEALQFIESVKNSGSGNSGTFSPIW